jgi:hypothetical protein
MHYPVIGIEGLMSSREPLVAIASVPAKIRSARLPNKSVERCCYSKLFSNVLTLNELIGTAVFSHTASLLDSDTVLSAAASVPKL